VLLYITLHYTKHAQQRAALSAPSTHGVLMNAYPPCLPAMPSQQVEPAFGLSSLNFVRWCVSSPCSTYTQSCSLMVPEYDVCRLLRAGHAQLKPLSCWRRPWRVACNCRCPPGRMVSALQGFYAHVLFSPLQLSLPSWAHGVYLCCSYDWASVFAALFVQSLLPSWARGCAATVLLFPCATSSMQLSLPPGRCVSATGLLCPCGI